MKIMKKVELSDRIKMAYEIKVTSAMRRKLALEVSWYDVHGDSHTEKFSVDQGQTIEF